MAARKASKISRALFVAGLLAVLATGFVLFSSGDEQAVLLPVVLVLLFIVPALVMSFERSGGVPIDDIGALYLVVLMLYFLFPIATYWARDFSFTPFNDSRLFAAHPSPIQIAAIEWRYAAYIVPCVIAYLLFAPSNTSGNPRELKANPRMFFWCVLILAGLETIVLLFDSIYQVSGTDYGEFVHKTYEVYHNLPHLLVQIEAHSQGMLVIAEGATLVFLFRSYKKYRLFIFAWLIVEAIIVVGGLGSRSPLVFLMLMMAILYDRFAKRIRPLVATGGAILFLSGYLIFGFVRAHLQPGASDSTMLTSNNEFEALFGNAFDLYRRAENGSLPEAPWQVRFADFVAPIPSQLLPFEKLDQSVWYARILGIEDTGAGYAFGVIPQGAIGWGWAELVVKGLLSGYLLARLLRWYKANSNKYWVTVVYLYLEVSCYWLFRESPFYFITLLFFNVLPFYVVVRLLSATSKSHSAYTGARVPLSNASLYSDRRLL